MKDNFVHPRFSSNAVNRYAHVMRHVINNFPNVITINPKPFSPITFQARFRDAMRAVVEFDQPFDKAEELRKIHDEIVVSQQGSLIKIGSREQLKHFTEKENNIVVGGLMTAEVMPISETLSQPTAEVIKALATLLDNRVIQEAVISGVPISLVQTIISDNDCDAFEGRDGKILLA